MNTLPFLTCTLILYLYPLIYGYKNWFGLENKLIIVWIVSVVFATTFVFYRGKQFNPKRLLLAFWILAGFWFVKNSLIERSEYVYFYTHKYEFENIVQLVKENKLKAITSGEDTDLYFYKNYKVAKGSNFVAIGVKGILDNTDGFMFWTGFDPPWGFFEGNLIFKERIHGSWYRFSTR